ncbi:MAG TPA: endonuclease III [Chlamydiales bacterium]|nr:endonuclease III [Chlamydiales bacterium]
MIHQKINLIQSLLNHYFPNPEIPLNHFSPYTLLIATVLSAQCTDQRVNQVTKILFEIAPTPEKMLLIPLRRLEEIIRPCGLYQTKAKYLHSLSKILVEKHDGKVPKTFNKLEDLPGVGHKTASVVLGHAFQIPAFPVDTHIHRLAKRWGLSSGKSVLQTEKDLKKLFDQKDWEKIHLQMIYFGRTFCKAKGHDPKKCPICSALQTT